MRRFTQLVFDDFVVGTGNVYTSPVYEDLMGSADRLAIQAVVDQFTGTSPTLTIQVEHGSDSRNYSSKSGTPEINGVSLSGSSTVLATGVEPGEPERQVRPAAHRVAGRRVQFSLLELVRNRIAQRHQVTAAAT